MATMAPPVFCSKGLTACVLFVAISRLTVTIGGFIQPCSESNVVQEVYDIAFEFRDECSMTVSWEAPECVYPIARYTLQSALGCPSNWTNRDFDANNDTSFKTKDIELITSCLQGECYLRVVAELDRSEHSQTLVSDCYGLSDTFYESYTIPLHLQYVDQHVCIPITATCPSGTVPNFIINEHMISWPIGRTREDDVYVNGSRLLCIRNSGTLVVHEVCHTDPNCRLCSFEDGELILMRRTVAESRSLSTQVEDLHCAPCVANLCTTNSYKADIVDEQLSVPMICICLPLFNLLRNTADDIMVKVNITFLYDAIFSGQQNTSISTDVNIPLTNSSHCIDLTMKDINQFINGNASLNICLTILGSNGTKKCAHAQEKCVHSQVEITYYGKHRLTTIIISSTVPMLIVTIGIITIIISLLIRRMCGSDKYAVGGGCGDADDGGCDTGGGPQTQIQEYGTMHIAAI